MGGSLIQSAFGLPEKRLSKQEFFPLVAIILDKFKRKQLYGEIPNFKLELIDAYREKSSFGDVDLLCEKIDNFDIESFIEKEFGIKPYRNGESFTFPFEGFQVDINLISPLNFVCAKNYSDYSPQGNAVGKLWHTMGLRYGHDGLFYFIRESDCGGEITENSHVLEKLYVSTDTKQIHELIGLDHVRFSQGFDSELDIFRWIGDSKYFNPARFSFEEMNHKARVRDSKRPDYNRLVKWIDDNKQNLPSCIKLEDKRQYLPMLFEMFPHLEERIKVNKEKYLACLTNKSKFNGLMVQEWVGISGITLGTNLKKFRKEIENQELDWNYFLAKNSEEEIKKRFMKFFLESGYVKNE